MVFVDWEERMRRKLERSGSRGVYQMESPVIEIGVGGVRGEVVLVEGAVDADELELGVRRRVVPPTRVARKSRAPIFIAGDGVVSRVWRIDWVSCEVGRVRSMVM